MTLKINDFYDLDKYRLFRNDAKDSKYKYVYVIMVNEAEKDTSSEPCSLDYMVWIDGGIHSRTGVLRFGLP